MELISLVVIIAVIACIIIYNKFLVRTAEVADDKATLWATNIKVDNVDRAAELNTKLNEIVTKHGRVITAKNVYDRIREADNNPIK